MDSENRNKRDLPEVVANILITLDKGQQTQERMDDGFSRLENAFNNMTTAVLDAMNRQTERYDGVQTAQTTQ
jgi:hypothetical protein